MTIGFDHALVMVEDLERAGRDFHQRYGLASVEGGRHTGLGTGNRIVPLGPDYLELMAVVDADEAQAGPLGPWVTALESSSALGALCLRTNDIESVASRLGSPALPMQRVRPDGVVLAWRLAGLDQTLSDPSLPFFIQWDVPPQDMPGAASVPHEVSPHGIAWVEVCGDDKTVRERVGEDLDIRVVAGSDRGLTAVGIATADDVLEIRQP